MTGLDDSGLYSGYDQLPVRMTKGLNTAKWLSILSVLKSGTHSEQVVALTELSNLLSYSNEEYLLGFPSFAYIKVLFQMLENPQMKYCELYPKNKENGQESQDQSAKVNFPYYRLLSSVYGDDAFMMDSIYREKTSEGSDREASDDNKTEHEEAGMEIDEEMFKEEDEQVFTNKMILSATCLNTILDIVPYTSRYFAMNGNLTTLCLKLSDLEYIDLAERILLIFEKLSHEIPLSLLRKSVLYHMIKYIDFFPLDIQISTLNCVLNVVRLADSKESFSKYLVPILSQLSGFLNNENKKLVEVVIAIWKELVGLVTRIRDARLSAEFVNHLSENKFLERILQLILTQNMGRSSVLEHIFILSSLVRMSTEMVRELLRCDQLENIKSLCYNQKDSLQFMFINLLNSILLKPNSTRNPRSNDTDNKDDMDNFYNSGHEDMDKEIDDDQLVLDQQNDYSAHDEQTTGDNKEDTEYKEEDRDEFFVRQSEYFGKVYELVKVEDLCDLCHVMTSDRHKSGVIELIHNLMRIGNKIEKYREFMKGTLSVSKTTEFVSTCLLQVELSADDALDNLLGILEVLFSVFGREVVVTFQRYGIGHYVRRSIPQEKELLRVRGGELLELLMTGGSEEPSETEEGERDEVDVFFEIRRNIEVWTPYELVRNVPLSKLNFFGDEESLVRFTERLVSQSFTTKQLEVLWKALLKILQYTNLYNNSPNNFSWNNSKDNPTIVNNNTSNCNKDKENNNPSKDKENSGKEEVHLFGEWQRKKVGFEGTLKKYFMACSSHPFNLIHSEIKLRLRPIYSQVNEMYKHLATVKNNQLSKDGSVAQGETDVIMENETKKEVEGKKEEEGSLLPISVYVPCLVKVARIENYVKKYVEKKTNLKVGDVTIYINETSVSPTVLLYEALCRFGGFSTKRRRQIVNQAHLIKYTYTLKNSCNYSSDTNSNSSSTPTNNNNNTDNKSTDTNNNSLNKESEENFVVTSLNNNNKDIKEVSNKDIDGEELGQKIYKLYKRERFSFQGILEEMRKFQRDNDERNMEFCDFLKEKKDVEILKDDTTLTNTYRMEEDEIITERSMEIDNNSFNSYFVSNSNYYKNDYCNSSNKSQYEDNYSNRKDNHAHLKHNYTDLKYNHEAQNNSHDNHEQLTKKESYEELLNEEEDYYIQRTRNYINSLRRQIHTSNYDHSTVNYDVDHSNYEENNNFNNCVINNLQENQYENNYKTVTGEGNKYNDQNKYEPVYKDYRREEEKAVNPIIYIKREKLSREEEKRKKMEQLIKLVKYDQNRLSFILGEDNEFEDRLVEASFPKFSANFSNDKKVLLKTMSIIATLNNYYHYYNYNYYEFNDNLNMDSYSGHFNGNFGDNGSFHSHLVDNTGVVGGYEGDMTDNYETSDNSGYYDSQAFEESNKLGISNSLSLKLLSACSELGVSLCFGLDHWVRFALSCPEVFSLRSRTVLFRMNTAGLTRNLVEFYSRLRSVSNDVIGDVFDEYLFEYVANNRVRLIDEEVKLPRCKLRLDRERVLEEGMRGFEKLQNNQKLEVEYKNEVGIGSGPTLEFFTIISEKFANFEDPKLLDCSQGLYFPTPHKINYEHFLRNFNNYNSDSNIDYDNQENFNNVNDNFTVEGKNNCNNYEENCNKDDKDQDEGLEVKLFRMFSFLGKVCAYALLEEKLFDLFFHSHFWNLVKFPNRPQMLTLEKLAEVDPKLAEGLEKVRNDQDPRSLHLTFEFQGYELFEGGSQVYVDRDNVDEYVQRIINFKLLEGVQFQIWSFRFGFSQLLPLYSLWFFRDCELSEAVFGNLKNQNEFWKREHLTSYIVPDHGYDAASAVYRNLIEILEELTLEERRLFLKFTTGAPILPKQGFKSLVPLMRVVKKGNVDELPSVMTCTNYLKMPEYESKSEMRHKLLKAIHEGQNAFNLS